MSKHISISASEAADRLSIRELVESYAHCADRRDAKGQMALFTPDAHFVVAGVGLPNGCDDFDACGHEFVLIPCDAAGCQDNAGLASQSATAVVSSASAPDPQKTREFIARFRARAWNQYHMPVHNRPVAGSQGGGFAEVR